MKRGNFQIKKRELVFPEESGLVIEKILEEHGLTRTQEEGVKKIIESKVLQERIEIFENLPGTKLSKLVKEYAEGEISLAEIPSRIAEQLNIPEKKAKEIAQDLEKSLLVLITPLKEEGVIAEKPFRTLGEILFGSKKMGPENPPRKDI